MSQPASALVTPWWQGYSRHSGSTCLLPSTGCFPVVILSVIESSCTPLREQQHLGHSSDNTLDQVINVKDKTVLNGKEIQNGRERLPTSWPRKHYETGCSTLGNKRIWLRISGTHSSHCISPFHRHPLQDRPSANCSGKSVSPSRMGLPAQSFVGFMNNRIKLGKNSPMQKSFGC